jgi:hypothetical protein
MRYLNRLIWTALIAAATSSPVLAQGGMSGGGISGGGISGGGISGGGMSGGGLGGGGGTSNSSTTLASLGQTPSITAPTTAGGNTGNTVSTSNFLAEYYGNPYYQGTLSNSQSNNNAPGGFGAVLFNTGSSSGGGQIGFAGGASGGTASKGTTGGARGGASSANSSNQGIIIPLPVQISYAAIPKFKIDPVSATQLQTEIIRMLRASKDISYPASILIATEGNTVTIRGNAKDRDEARYVEGMIKMTPGVHQVKNELSYPKDK